MSATARRSGVPLALVLALGCDRFEPSEKSSPAPNPAPAQMSAVTTSERPPRPAPETLLSGPPAAGCRAIEVAGEVADSAGEALKTGDALPSGWLKLEDGAKLTIKHAESGREMRIAGSARALPCYRGGEHVLIAQGTILTTATAGARPGAEVLLATPFGSVRYGDAELVARVSKSELVVEVRKGTAWVEGSGEPAPEQVEAGKQARRQATPVDVKPLVRACESAADAARERARALLDETREKRSLGRRAAEQLRARQQARKACGIALAALERLPAAAQKERLAARLEKAEARWRTLPEEGAKEDSKGKK